MKKHLSKESHKSAHIGWLRAAVLGANDGIVSTASLIIGVAASQASQQSVLTAGIAGLVAGAMSMAAGEYVSVSSQADTETADLAREKAELLTDHEAEKEELAQIYVQRGLDYELAKQVSKQLMAHDALGAHARDELGITEIFTAKPLQAAFSSAAAFAVGGSLPLIVALVTPARHLIATVSVASVVCLIFLGMAAARTGGANMCKGALRVSFWGIMAMALTACVGYVFGVA